MSVKIGVECQMFVIVIFFNCSQVLQFGAHSRYYNGALTQKRYFLVIDPYNRPSVQLCHVI